MIATPNNSCKIAVTSRAFSKNPILRSELLDKYPKTTFNDAGVSLRGEELKTFLSGHDAAIIALEPIDCDLLAFLPSLKIVSKYGVGLDKINLKSLIKHNVRLGWVGGVNRRSVSELALAFMISCLRHINIANTEVREGIWRQHLGNLLTGKTVGLVGLGNVGKDLVQLLKPFDCKIYANDIVELPDFCKTNNVIQTTKSELLRKSEVISVHVPLTKDTRGMIGKEAFSTIKKGAILINTARGELVDENELKVCLRSGHLSAAAFDVFAQEPPEDLDLLTLPNFIATPHIGGSAREAILAMGRAAINQIENARQPLPEYFG